MNIHSKGIVRLLPGEEFFEKNSPYLRIAPADGLKEWVFQELLCEEGQLYNADHAHLLEADIAFLWAANSSTKKGRIILGQTEEVILRGGGWKNARVEQQLYEWFGRKPEFIITLAGDFCSQCSDLEFCALVEHELYHIAQALDEFGVPKFYRDSGLPKLCIRGHDVEEFTGVVRRYGASHEVQELIDAASQPAEVAKINIARACGTCMLKLA